MGKKKMRGNGEGTCYYNEKTKKYVAQATVDGRRISRSGKTKSEARKKLDLAINEILLKPADEASYTIHNILKSLADDDFAFNLIQEVSYKRRLDTLEIIDKYGLGSVVITKCNELMLKKFFKEITHYSNSVISKVYQSVKKAFNYACKKKIITENCFDDIICPKSSKKDKKVSALTVEEQRSFVSVLLNEEAGNKCKYQMLLMLYTGMRCGEVNALTVSDINFTFKTININKTVTKDKNDKSILSDRPKTDAGNRILRMTATVESLLREYMDSRFRDNELNLLFYNFDKKGVVPTAAVNYEFKKIIRKYNVINQTKEMRALSERGSEKVAYKKYTYYRKTENGFEKLGLNPPPDWNLHFGEYFEPVFICDKVFNLHMLRHTFATRCIENGIDYLTLKDILGHTDIKITLDTYCDVLGEYKERQYQLVEKINQAMSLPAPDSSKSLIANLQ